MPVSQEDITILNIYWPKEKTTPQNSPKLEQTLTDLKEETDSSKIMVGDTNIPFSIMDRISIHINKKKEDLNDTIKHLQLTSIYRTRYSMTAKYTYLSIVNGTLSRVEHILSQEKYHYIKKYRGYTPYLPNGVVRYQKQNDKLNKLIYWKQNSLKEPKGWRANHKYS